MKLFLVRLDEYNATFRAAGDANYSSQVAVSRALWEQQDRPTQLELVFSK